MARILTDRNEFRFEDHLSYDPNKTENIFYFRWPTAKERAGYTNEQVKRKGNKVVTCVGEVQQKYGEKILTGFREGDVEIKKDGKQVKIRLAAIRFN